MFSCLAMRDAECTSLVMNAVVRFCGEPQCHAAHAALRDNNNGRVPSPWPAEFASDALCAAHPCAAQELLAGLLHPSETLSKIPPLRATKLIETLADDADTVLASRTRARMCVDRR